MDSSEQSAARSSVEQAPNKLQSQQLLNVAKRTLLFNRYVFVDCFEESITSFVTTRFGGNSSAPFDTMNMAYHVGDDPLVVASNRKQVCNDFGFEHLCFMDQHHTNVVMVVDEHNVNQGVFACDGIVTKLRDVALAVMTADCLPLLLCDEEKGVIGAIHCGWRGIADGIIANAIEEMEEQGARRNKIVAYMGPAIGPRSFLVGGEVRERFVSQYAPYAKAFVDWVVINPPTELSSPVALASSAFSLDGTAAVLGEVTRSAVIKQVQERVIKDNSADPLAVTRGMSAIVRLVAMTESESGDAKGRSELEEGAEAKEAEDVNEAKAETTQVQDSQAKDYVITTDEAFALSGSPEEADAVDALGAATIPPNASAVGSMGYTEVFHDPNLSDISILYLQNKYLCNIYELAVLSLQRAGADGFVYGGRFDTYAQSSMFYSYRKDKVTGRMATVIALNR